MLHSLSKLLALSAMTGALLAQNDDCSGAIPVVQGTNGPFTNVGSTTSAPWICAFGDNDVWFVYVAPDNGTLTVDTCGAQFDTVMEVFDGPGGCGTLSSLDCNDDTCGVASSVTVAVTAGMQVFIRVGGFAGDVGTFDVNVNGPIGTGTVATGFLTGTGCGASAGSFYEHFLTAVDLDLGNSGITMFGTSPGYIVTGSGTFVPPSVNAIAYILGDDDEVTQSLTTAFPYDGGSTTALTICSNGFISVAPGNGTDFFPDPVLMLAAPETAWWVWHDFNPNGGGGVVKFEEIGTIAYVTWDGVWDFNGTTIADANTMQFQFDSSTGSVTIVFETMSALGGTGFLVGYSAGGPSLDPTSIDLSASLPSTIVVPGVDVLPLTLASLTRPITGTVWNMQVNGIPGNAVIGLEIFGTSNPAIPDLTFLGMPGCGLNASLDVLNVFPVLGATHAFSLVIPAAPTLINAHIYTTSAVLQSPPINTFGAILSNGVDGKIGDV